MLKNIDPLLNADVLYALAAMGHGDEIVVADANFPGETMAKQTTLGRLLRIDTATTGEAVRAVLSVLPLDSFVEDAACRMEVVGKPDQVEPVQAEAQKAIDAAEGKPWPLVGVERFAFYERAKKSFAIIQTLEPRFYGCIILKKGVFPPPA